MNSERIKSFFNSKKKANDRRIHPKSAKTKLEHFFKKMKKSSASEHGDTAGSLWLKENASLYISTVKSSDFRKFKAKESTLQIIRSLICSTEFSGTNEEMLSFFEVFSQHFSPSEEELASIRTAFYYVLSEQICKDAEGERKLLPHYFQLFHRFRTIDFDHLTQLFSPIEKAFRFDPAGIWGKMTKGTQNLYKRRLLDQAERNKITPEKQANLILKQANKEGKHIGWFLPEAKRGPKPDAFILIIYLFLLFDFIFAFRSFILSVFISLPLYFFVKSFVDFVVSLIVKPEPLPSMRIDKVKDDDKTCVIITSLITSESDVDRLCEKLLQYKYNNAQEGDALYFGLLCDLKESDREIDPNDRLLIQYLDENVSKLPGGIFFSAVRPRVFHESENKWVGWERKRGAVEQFISHLTGADIPGIYWSGCWKEIVGSKYLITLDGDTRLGIGQAKRLIGIASHPLNRPMIKKRKGRMQVTSGYGILQPRISASLLERIKTPFGKIYGNGSGGIAYASASYDPMQYFHGEGNFCGKGLIDVSAYAQVVSNTLPEQAILSHDMPEGALLRCGLVTDEYFSDSNPQTTISFYKRQHRWIRGDVQNLAIFKILSNTRKFFAIENLLLYLVPLSEWLLLISSALIGKTEGTVCAFLILLFHGERLLFTVASAFLSGNVELFGRRFVTRMRNLVLNAFYQFLLSLSVLCFEAIYFADAMIRSIYRMTVSRKQLLEWQVYSPFTKGKTDLSFYIPSVLLSLFSCVLVQNPFQITIFLLCLSLPLLSRILSTPYSESTALNADTKNYLLKKAEKEFRFFKECVNEKTSFLPPDNIQISPFEKIAMRTSPTNIGLYLASLTAAKDLGIISGQEMVQRVEKAVDTISRLEHWNGHLYNWYDLNTMKVIGDPFVSTVDSGNFIAGMIVALQALKEMKDQTKDIRLTIKKMEDEISGADFQSLFHKERNLFRVGVDTEAEKDAVPDYDLYMSESRITSFLAISLGQVPAHHWSALSRPLLSFQGRVGIGSWSGTAFEYFMPSLFLPIIENSLEDETLDFALYCQKKHSANATEKKKVFGISESGYSLMDAQGNYQYKAFGVPYLSIQPEQCQNKVISPYSTFLMLAKKHSSLIDNLNTLSNMGLEGDFGYYEACEFNSRFLDDFQIIYSYMAHHKGMSVLALANAVCDCVIQKRFLSYDHFEAKLDLLAERFPIEGAVHRRKREKYPALKKSVLAQEDKTHQVSQNKSHANLITDGKITILSYDNGENTAIYQGENLFSPKGINFTFCLGNETYEPSINQKDSWQVCHGRDYTEYTMKKGKLSIGARIELIGGRGIFLVRIRVDGCAEPCKILLDFDAVMEHATVYDAHPAFHDLAVEGTLLDRHLILRRRGIEVHRYLHIFSSHTFRTAIQGKPPEAAFENRMLLSPKVRLLAEFKSGEAINTVYLFQPNQWETVPDPFALLDGSFHLQRSVKQQSLDKMIRLAELSPYNDACREIENKILTQVLGRRRFFILSNDNSRKRESLWGYGISGDYPMLLCILNEEKKEAYELVENLIYVIKKFKLAGVKLDLVVLHRSAEMYFDPIREHLTGIITKTKSEFLVGKHSGIHIVPYQSEEEMELFTLSAAAVFGVELQSLKEVPESKLQIRQQSYQVQHDAKQVGHLENNGFMIEKDQFDPPVPYAQIVSNRVCGFVCNQNSLGFTWHRNAGLNRISKWDNLPDKNSGEKLLLNWEGNWVDLIQSAKKVTYRRHFAVYEGTLCDYPYEIFASVSERVAGKLIYLHFSEELCRSELIFSMIPALGSKPKENILVECKGSIVALAPAMQGEYPGKAYLYLKNGVKQVSRSEDRLLIHTESKKENLIVLGGYSTAEHLEFIQHTLDNTTVNDLFADEKAFSDLFFAKGQQGKDFWIRYQAIHCRFFGRTGLYQSSGAYGFRDQLQDCLVLLEGAPSFARLHILRAASHQFSEGDVQHWWHTVPNVSRCHPGIRSRCSDDYLWLIFAVTEYLRVTGDDEILKVTVPFLKAPPLKEGQDEAYFIPQKGESASLLEHLNRAVSLFISRGLGPHDLPDIGSGDWNDGMNRLKGESVWLGFFASICLHRILPYLDTSLKESAEAQIQKINEALKNAFNGCWFLRVYRDNGEPIGNNISLENECSIDLITQAFAALYFMELKNLPENMVEKALKCAYEILFDPNSRTTALFTKPFVNTSPTPGYIQRYCAGARENGGQYTHAAVWFSLAMVQFGNDTGNEALVQKGIEVAECLDPFINLDAKMFKRYQREPYVLCGDVFTAPGIKGHGGWSWYTGAAGWYLRLREEIRKQKRVP